MNKYCKDCKHCDKSGSDYKCHRDAVNAVDMVTGKIIKDRVHDCYHQRRTTSSSCCGPDGNYWEQL